VDDRHDVEIAADDPGDTWAEALFLPDLLTQTVRRVVFRDEAKRALRFTEEPELNRVTVDQADSSLPKAVVFHDSFGLRMPRILGRHFSHAVFVLEREFDVELLEREKPDVVVQIISDRALARRHYPHSVFVWNP
ncbi:MAG TPA: hypothetical protein VM509_14860, partial [Planctomycetota bacterium]|nr:hypothetical protein [Planctomycetota bacterium]